jgi:hypothetical protein
MFYYLYGNQGLSNALIPLLSLRLGHYYIFPRVGVGDRNLKPIWTIQQKGVFLGGCLQYEFLGK